MDVDHSLLDTHCGLEMVDEAMVVLHMGVLHIHSCTDPHTAFHGAVHMGHPDNRGVLRHNGHPWEGRVDGLQVVHSGPFDHSSHEEAECDGGTREEASSHVDGTHHDSWEAQAGSSRDAANGSDNAPLDVRLVAVWCQS